MQKIFFYKLTHDTGGAPCIDNGILTLAICKPRIRSVAEPGNLIFGFAANSLHRDNRLIYVAQVTDKMCNGSYYESERFRKRGDCIYERRGTRFVWRAGSRHHGPEDLIYDLGEPPDYKKSNVIVSTDFRYFGGDGSAAFKTRYPRIKAAVETLGRGHRTKHAPELWRDLLSLKNRVWKETSQMVAGRPTSRPSRQICYRGKSCGILNSK